MSLCGQAPAQPAARSAATTRRRRPWPCEVQGLWLVRGEWLRLESEEEQVRWLQERALPQAGALDRAEGRESSVRPVWLRTMKSLKEGWIWLSASVRVAIGARSGISGALTVPEASAALALACVPAEPRRNALCTHRRRCEHRSPARGKRRRLAAVPTIARADLRCRDWWRRRCERWGIRGALLRQPALRCGPAAAGVKMTTLSSRQGKSYRRARPWRRSRRR